MTCGKRKSMEKEKRKRQLLSMLCNNARNYDKILLATELDTLTNLVFIIFNYIYFQTQIISLLFQIIHFQLPHANLCVFAVSRIT